VIKETFSNHENFLINKMNIFCENMMNVLLSEESLKKIRMINLVRNRIIVKQGEIKKLLKLEYNT